MRRVVLGLHSEIDLQKKIEGLSQRLNLVVGEPQPGEAVLDYFDGKLGVYLCHRPRVGPVFVDWVSGAHRYRQRQGLAQNQLLAKAFGLKSPGLRVLDLTAGWGNDAFHVAGFGGQVTAVEGNPLLFELLQDGLRRFRETAEFLVFKGQLEVRQGLASGILKVLADERRTFDVVYFDPMFPVEDRAAKSAKDLQILQYLYEPADLEAQNVDLKRSFERCRELAQDRIVVKRPLHAPPLFGESRHVFKGKSVRFDVYK